MKSKRLRELANSVTAHVFVVLALVFMLTPIIWLVSTSLKDTGEMFSLPLHLIPERFAWENYSKIWRAIPFATYLKNSIVVAVYATFVAVGLSCFGAYAFSRFKFRGRDLSLRVILFSQMFPAVLLIIPIFIYIKNLGLLGTYTGLMITYLTFLVPFSTWALTNFFDTVPVDLEEAAMIDGCTRVGALFRVVLPVSLPGLVSVGTYCFLTSWNEFIFAMAFMSDQNRWTLPVGLSALTSQYALDWGLLTAGGVISLVPAVFIVLFLQRYLIAGLTPGAVKE